MSSSIQPIEFQTIGYPHRVMLPDKFPVSSLDLEDVNLEVLPSMLTNRIDESHDSTSSERSSNSRLVYSCSILNIPGITIPESRTKTPRATKTPSSHSSSVSNRIRRSTYSPTDEMFISKVSSKDLWINQYKSGKSSIDFEM
jgi:hypothetical protein